MRGAIILHVQRKQPIIINPDASRHLSIFHLFFPVGELGHPLLVSHLKLSQKNILCKGIGIGDRSTGPSPLMVAKLIIDRDLTLDLGWKILEVVIKTHDGARIHIVAQRRTGIKLFIHYNRFIVLKWPVRNKILPQHIPCPPLDTRRSVSPALDHIRTGSLSWSADGGLV